MDYSEIELAQTLRGVGRSVVMIPRCEIIRNGAVVREIEVSGSVTLDSEAEIMRVARFTLNDEIDWLHDRIYPHIMIYVPPKEGEEADKVPITWGMAENSGITWTEISRQNLKWEDAVWNSLSKKDQSRFADFPLGIFIPSTVKKQRETGRTYYEVEAYDETVILQEDCIMDRLFFSAETPYQGAIKSILAEAGIEHLQIKDKIDAALPADREFEIGTSKLEIVNSLLDEINFYPIYVNQRGQFIIERYREPSPEQARIIYNVGEQSVICEQSASEFDYYAAPNVFVAVCDNPDIGQSFRAVYQNDNPESNFSTVNRGRKITSEIYKPDMIPSAEYLNEYVRKKAFEQYQRYEYVTFETITMPVHGVREIINIIHPTFSGVFQETGWSIDLQVGTTMIHNARRLIIL